MLKTRGASVSGINDPAVIEWLEGEESRDWRRMNLQEVEFNRDTYNSGGFYGLCQIKDDDGYPDDASYVIHGPGYLNRLEQVHSLEWTEGDQKLYDTMPGGPEGWWSRDEKAYRKFLYKGGLGWLRYEGPWLSNEQFGSKSFVKHHVACVLVDKNGKGIPR